MLPDHAETGVPEAERKVRFSHKIDILTPKEIDGMRKVCKVYSLSRLRFVDWVAGEGGSGYYCRGIETRDNDTGVRSDLS